MKTVTQLGDWVLDYWLNRLQSIDLSAAESSFPRFTIGIAEIKRDDPLSIFTRDDVATAIAKWATDRVEVVEADETDDSSDDDTDAELSVPRAQVSDRVVGSKRVLRRATSPSNPTKREISAGEALPIWVLIGFGRNEKHLALDADSAGDEMKNIITCMAIPALINAEGQLLPPPDQAKETPFIPRKMLEPQPSSAGERQIALGLYEDWQKALEDVREMAPASSWREYANRWLVQFESKLLRHSSWDVKERLPTGKYANNKRQWGTFYLRAHIVGRVPGYATKWPAAALQALLVNPSNVDNAPVLRRLLGQNGATLIIKSGWKPDGSTRLHSAMVETKKGPAAATVDPLNPAQRRAVHSTLSMSDGGIVAVSGPPGTGKTAMLRAIMASRWTTAAAQDSPCPITICCGATNQSVENVISTFDDALFETDRIVDGPERKDSGSFTGRWLTFQQKQGGRHTFAVIDRLAASAPAAGRVKLHVKKTDPAYAVIRLDPPDHMVRREFERDSPRLWFDGVARPISEVASPDVLINAAREWLEAYDRAIKDRSKSRIGHLFSERDHSLTWLARNNLILDDFRNIIPQQVGVIDGLRHALECLRRALRNLLNSYEKQNTSEESFDREVRPGAFQLAVHIWEAEWLQAEVGGPTGSRIEALRRAAMLFPCIVSTLHSIPRLVMDPTSGFPFGEIDLVVIDEAGQAPPELAVPALSFARRAVVVGDLKQLAPISQFEPDEDARTVADIIRPTCSGRIDGLKGAVDSANKNLSERGALASTGSAMKLAATAASFKEPGERFGLLLREHFRCARSIISVCIDLLYSDHDRDEHGKVLEFELLPRKSNPRLVTYEETGKDKFPLPALGFVAGGSINDEPKRTESWINEREARVLVEWFLTEGPKVATWLSRSTGKEHDLADTFAILSPYRGQVELIRTLVEERLLHGAKGKTLTAARKTLRNLKIGTVHTMQGGERPVVLFSAVNSRPPDDGKTKVFVDRDGGNLLNVAISRAKESFILFGHSELFFSAERLRSATPEGVTRPDPTAVLGAHMVGLRRPQPRTIGRDGVAGGIKLGPIALVVVESPLKAKKLERTLPIAYGVMGSMGHVRDLAFGSVDIDAGLTPNWGMTDHGTDLVRKLAARLIQTRHLVLATDDDEQGEAIAWHLLQLLVTSPHWRYVRTVSRVRFHSLDDTEISRAFGSARTIEIADASGRPIPGADPYSVLHMGMVYSVIGLRILDNLLGKLYSNHGAHGCGRVKGALLRAIAGDPAIDPQGAGISAVFRTPRGPLTAELSMATPSGLTPIRSRNRDELESVLSHARGFGESVSPAWRDEDFEGLSRCPRTTISRALAGAALDGTAALPWVRRLDKKSVRRKAVVDPIARRPR